jgi:O-acetyl-ADP-ribose deacetylase (regulator of RNase III)
MWVAAMPGPQVAHCPCFRCCPHFPPSERCTSLYACCTCSAGRLQAKYIIHTVGPVYENAEESAPLLRQAYA